MTRPYPSYTDSGVDWLGLVPTHWEITQIKHACRIFPSNVDKHSKENESRVYLCNYTDVYHIEEITSNIDFMVSTASEREIEKFTLRAGDVVFTKDSETADDIAVAAFVPRDLQGVVCGYHLYISRPSTGTDGAFIKRFFDSSFARACFEVRANGLTRVGLSQHAAENVPIALPPSEEQRAIAAFLDRETGKIDAAVEEQRRLIALLKEKRQAVISHAVTKGLNPDAPMKPSGIDWLGDIPEHWEVRKIGSVSTKITNGYVGPTRDVLHKNGVPYLQSLHIKRNKISFDTPYYVKKEWSDQHAKSILKTDDVLIVQTGDIGQVAVVPPEYAGCNCHALIIVSPMKDVLSGKWISWVLCSDYGFHSLLSIKTGALHPHLNCGNVKFIWLPIPPLEEQERIITSMSGELGKIDALISEAETGIDLLQERRSTLISAAVTGKIDVRDEVADQQGEQRFEGIEASVGA